MICSIRKYSSSSPREWSWRTPYCLKVLCSIFDVILFFERHFLRISRLQGVLTLRPPHIVSVFTKILCFYNRKQNQKKIRTGLNKTHNLARSFRINLNESKGEFRKIAYSRMEYAAQVERMVTCSVKQVFNAVQHTTVCGSSELYFSFSEIPFLWDLKVLFSSGRNILRTRALERTLPDITCFSNYACFTASHLLFTQFQSEDSQ